MKPRILALAFALLAATGALWFYFANEEHVAPPAPDTSTPRSTDGEVTASGKAPGDRSSAVPHAEITRASEELNLDRIHGILSAKFGESDAADKMAAAFLAKHGETATNLLALLTAGAGDKWLDRALELFPNHPAVLLTALERHSGDERASLIARYKAADANNPLPWIFSAAELFKSQQPDQALAEIREALKRPAFYTHTTERIESLRNFAFFAGATTTEAQAWSTFALPLYHMSSSMAATRGLNDLANSPAAEAPRIRESAQLMYGLSRVFATPEASRLIIGQLASISMETKALTFAQADGTANLLPVEPAARLAELERMKQDIRELTGETDALLRANNPARLTEYLNRVRTEGELSALRWLKAQVK